VSELSKLPTFGKDGAVHVVVESPRGSTLKLKYEPELNVFSISRPLPLGMRYPFDWGFVPGTRAPDGDPVDAVIAWDASSYPGVMIPCRIIGVLEVEQDRRGNGGRERNDRVVGVPQQSPRDNWTTVFEMPERLRKELDFFFLEAVAFEGKNVSLLGWKGPEAGIALIRRSTGG
jgi:inorganic pyrophosphatase